MSRPIFYILAGCPDIAFQTSESKYMTIEASPTTWQGPYYETQEFLSKHIHLFQTVAINNAIYAANVMGYRPIVVRSKDLRLPSFDDAAPGDEIVIGEGYKYPTWQYFFEKNGFVEYRKKEGV